MTTKMPDFTKDFDFTHISNEELIYTYHYRGIIDPLISWTNESNYERAVWKLEDVKQNIENGMWLVVEYEEEPNLAENVYKTMTDKLEEYNKHKDEISLLAQMKSFSVRTGSPIFIQPNGGYEVYYEDADVPAAVKTDDEMKKLIEALEVFYLATWGDEHEDA